MRGCERGKRELRCGTKGKAELCGWRKSDSGRSRVDGPCVGSCVASVAQRRALCFVKGRVVALTLCFFVGRPAKDRDKDGARPKLPL